MYQTFIKPLALDIKEFILDTLFPISCLGCNAEGEFICGNCKMEVSKLEHQRCIVCQKPTPFGFTHEKCLTPHGADGLISFYNYEDEKVSQILISGKYKFIPEIYNTLGTMMAARIKANFPYILGATQQIYSSNNVEKINLQENIFSTRSNNIFLTPIPLHSSRKRWRGFNQAELLCKAIAKDLNLEVANVLQRNKITKTQKDLKRPDRLKNVSDAFSLKPGEDVHGKYILLVDDVTTTGATLQEAAKVLKRNGAAKVICLTVARD